MYTTKLMFSKDHVHWTCMYLQLLEVQDLLINPVA